MVSESHRTRKYTNWRLGCEAHLCVPTSPVSRSRKCHLPRWRSAIVVYFFPTSFHDLLCLSLPAVSLVWNIFSSLYPIGSNSQSVLLTSGQSTARPRLPSALLCISAKGVFISFLLDLFYLQILILSLSLSRYTYLGFLFQYFICHCCMFGTEKVHQSMNSPSYPWPFFSAPSLYIQWLLSKGIFVSIDAVMYMGMS